MSIKDYQPPKMEFETRLASQTLSPFDEADLWLYNNIMDMGTRELARDTDTARAVVDYLSRKQGSSLNACDTPASPDRWQECKKAVKRAQRQRDKTYLQAKSFADTLLRWYNSEDLTTKGLKDSISTEDPELGRLDALRLRGRDTCPIYKDVNAIKDRDLEICQQNLVSAGEDQIKYRIAKHLLADLLGDWEGGLETLEEEFQQKAKEHQQEEKARKKFVVPRRKLSPTLPQIQEAKQTVEKIQDEKLNRSRRIFLQEKARPRFEALFAYQPRKYIPPVSNITPSIAKRTIRDKKLMARQIIAYLENYLQNKRRLSLAEEEDLLSRMKPVFGSNPQKYPPQIIQLWRQVEPLGQSRTSV